MEIGNNLAPFIGVPVLLLPMLGKSLNAFTLGESQARHMGVNTALTKRLVIVLATMAVGSSVAVSGIIGFGGLIIPHIIRMAFGSGDQDLDIVAVVMHETGVSHLANRDYTTLSGGEQQRVQLARVLAQIYDIEGAYLFLDEPTNGLDLLYQEQVLSVARRMADKVYGVVAILHDINFASRYSDRVLILKAGKMLAIGPARMSSMYRT